MEGFNLSQELRDAAFSLVLFAVIVPIEMFLNRESKDSLKNRVLNLAYMVGYLFIGGTILQLLLPYLEIVTPRARIRNPILYTIAYLFITDVIFYVYHRLQHTVPLLWKIHRAHHSDPDMNITTSFRTNLIEHPLQYVLITLPVALILGYNPQGSYYTFYAANFFLFLGHTKLNLNYGITSRVLITPAAHRIHHSSENIHRHKNFTQIFPIIDIIAGTYHHPEKGEFPKTGL